MESQMFGEKQVKMAAQLYAARDTIRKLYGKDYPKILSTYKEAIKNRMKKDGVSELPAMVRVCGDWIGSPNTCLLLMAAVVEMIEPSQETPHVQTDSPS